MKKTKIYLTETEWRLVIHSLNDFKTKMHREGQYTDIVGETLFKVVKALAKRVKTKPFDGILAG